MSWFFTPVTVRLVTAYSTETVYAVSAALKAGFRVPALTVRELRVASLLAALVAVTV
jgi:hypothetical protein